MLKTLITAALTAAMSLTAPLTAWGDHFTIALPERLPGGGEAVTPHLWSIITQTLEPGDHLTLLNAADPGLLAHLAIPDEPKYTSAKWRVKNFAPEIAGIGAYLEALEPGEPQIDLMGALRHVALNRVDPDAPLDLLILGSPVQRDPQAAGFDMEVAGEYFAPSPSHLGAAVTETPYGMGAEGGAGLENVRVHLCALGEDLSSDVEAAYQRFFGAYIAARSGMLVGWSDDLASCFARLIAQPDAPLDFAPYEPDDGPLRMVEITRPAPESEGAELAANGVPVEQFNLFSRQLHPRLPGIKVTTGIEYDPAAYPDIYRYAWCYFIMRKDGVEIRFDLGKKLYGEAVIPGESTVASRRAAGITTAQYEAAKPACQWPTP